VNEEPCPARGLVHEAQQQVKILVDWVSGTPSLRPRILVADDHFLIAEAISMLLAPHFDVVGVVTDAKLVADEVARLRPEVVLLDVTMPGLNGLDVARMILELAPNTKIVFLTMHANRVILKEALRAGASAFVVKNCAVSDLVLAVRTVLGGVALCFARGPGRRGTSAFPGFVRTTDHCLAAHCPRRQRQTDRLPPRHFVSHGGVFTRTRSWRNSSSARRATHTLRDRARHRVVGVPLRRGSIVRDLATDNAKDSIRSAPAGGC
jgi:CheY-like chemotaxis protein